MAGYSKALSLEELQQAATRLCSFVRCARLPLAESVLRNLLDAVDIVVSKRQMSALCSALEEQEQLLLHPGRVPRYGLGARSGDALDGEALARLVQARLAAAAGRHGTPGQGGQPDFGRVGSIFQLGQQYLAQDPTQHVPTR